MNCSICRYTDMATLTILSSAQPSYTNSKIATIFTHSIWPLVSIDSLALSSDCADEGRVVELALLWLLWLLVVLVLAVVLMLVVEVVLVVV